MKTILACLLFSLTVQVHAQVSRDSQLFLELKKEDSLLFTRAFNQCDLAYLESIAHKDLLAYYEAGEAQNRAKFIEDVRRFFCSDSIKTPLPEIDPNSLEVFTLEDHGVLSGAVQSGSINFYKRDSVNPRILTGTAKFVHVWVLEDRKWLLKEVMRFDHQSAK